MAAKPPQMRRFYCNSPWSAPERVVKVSCNCDIRLIGPTSSVPCKNPFFRQNKLTGSISTAMVTSSGSVSPATILARAWLSLLMERVRSMIW